MQIGRPGPAVSRIAQAYPDRVEVRGRDLCRDLMGRVTFTEYFHLLLTGDEPSGAALFNLADDPGEQSNVADEHPEILARLSTLIEQMQSQTGLPIGEGEPLP